MRLIDADAITTKTFVDFVGNQDYISFGDALWMISELPTVEAKPVLHGEWIKGDTGEWQCSVCREENCYAYCEPLKRFTDLYCPNCGADMRGGKSEQ